MTERKSEIEAERIETVSDAGKRYTVVRWQTIIHYSSSTGNSNLKGTYRFALIDGSSVNQSDTDTNAFKIVQTDEIIRKV